MFIQKFDTLSLVLPEECYLQNKTLKFRSQTNADENGEISSVIKYLSKEQIATTNPFGVSHASINSYKSLLLEISSKILLENYHKGISKETIDLAFSQLIPLGFEIDTDTALRKAKVRRADAFIDLAIDGNLNNVLSLFKFFSRKSNTYIKNHRGSVESYISGHILKILYYLKYKELHYLQAGHEVTDEEFYNRIKKMVRTKKALSQRKFLEIIDVNYFLNKLRIEASYKSDQMILSAFKSKSSFLSLGELLNTNVNLIEFAHKHMYVDLDKIDIALAAKTTMTRAQVVNEYGWKNIIEQSDYDIPTTIDFFKSHGVKISSKEKKSIVEQIVNRRRNKKPETIEFEKGLLGLLNSDNPVWTERSLMSML